MRVKVTIEGEILIDDKVTTDEQLSRDIELQRQALEDAKEIRKLIKQRDVLLRGYNTHGKDTAVVDGKAEWVTD